VLNPGVILNRDPEAHKKFLKPSPVASPIVNRCIECGFCESNCPSKDLSLTPRQRIASFREIARLTGGAYAAFDASAPRTLADLLAAAAAYAAGGRTALESQAGAGGDAARRLLGQMR
jgi:ferredoxin